MTITPYDVHDKIHKSKGMRYLGRAKARAFIRNVFTMNAKEASDALELAANPEFAKKYMAINNRTDSEQIHREINRLFHNFLAASMTLVEHTRILIRSNYHGTKLYNDYELLINRFISSNIVCKFVQDLRNYTLHRDLPIHHIGIKIEKEKGITAGVTIDASQLNSWDGWTAKSKAFINAQPKDIDPKLIVSDYCDVIELFNDTLDELIFKFHKPDIDEYNSLITLQTELIEIQEKKQK